MKSSNARLNMVCTTQRAAEILGISVSSVQQLVEAGLIEAWKTKGGHRRIPMAAIEAYKVSPVTLLQVGGMAAVAGKKPLILIIEDDAAQRDAYERHISSWELQATLMFCENGYQALIKIARHKPDILLADVVMDGIDGYEVIKTILTYPDLGDVNIAILSSQTLPEIAAHGGLPKSVIFFSKPVNYDELRGYLRACCAQKSRQSQFA